MADGHAHHDHSGHGHGHHHGHGHSHGHSHAPVSFGRAFLTGTVLNTGFVVVEAIYGIAANSVALLADAGHNLSDVLGLLIAWGAATLSARAPSTHYTYGFRRTSILAALVNALMLLIAIAAIAWEAVGRLADPSPIRTDTVMLVAGIGIAVNAGTAWLFASGRKGDINIRGAYLHMLADAAVSLGVVVAGLVIGVTGWLWLDPVTSLAIVVMIFLGTWRLLRDSVAMSLDRVPEGISPDEVEAAILALPGVTKVHDLHIWSMSTTETALTAHLEMPAGCPGDAFLHDTCLALRERFHIHHSTLQIEREAASCALEPAHVV